MQFQDIAILRFLTHFRQKLVIFAQYFLKLGNYQVFWGFV